MAKTTANREQTGGDDHVSIGQASKFLGVSVDTIRRWERAGKLKAYRLDGKNRYFRQKDLNFFRQLQPLSTSDVAKALGVSASTVRRLEAQGKLKSVRDHNGKRLYRPMSLSEYVTAAEPEELPTTSDLASQKTEIASAQTATATTNNRGDDSFRIGRWQRGLLRLVTAVLLVLLGVSLWQPHSKLNDVATTQPIKTPVAKLTIKDVNKSASLVLPSTFFVELPKAGLTVNITNQSITGVAKASTGPFATRPITNDELASGSVKLNNLAPDLQALISALPSSGTSTVTTVNQTTNQTTVVAGVGLSGSSTNNVLTLGVNTGKTVAVVNNNLEVRLSSGVVTSTQTSGSGLEATSSGLQLIGGCAAGQILAWNGTAWTCANGGGGGGSSVAVQENGTTITPTATAINFNGSDFTVVNNAGTATVAIDYANSGIAQVSATEAVTGNWSFKDSGFTLASAGDTTKKAQFDLSGVASGTTRTFSVPNTSGTLITSGNLTSITGTGALASGSIGSGFGAISTGNTISTTAGLQGGSLSVGSGAFAVNASGAITAATGIVSSGTVQFTGLGSAGVVYIDGTGKLSTSSVVLGADTIGAYVQSIGATTGITVGGTASVPTLSVIYGASADQAAQGNTALTFTGSGNLTGSLSGTAGGGFTTTTLAVSSTPSFTSVTAPTFTNAGNLALSATGAGHNLTLSASGSVILSGFNCSTFDNGGTLTTNASGVLQCSNDDGGAAGTITGSGTVGRLAAYSGTGSLGDSTLNQNGTTLELDAGNGFSLLGGDLNVVGNLIASNINGAAINATSFNGVTIGSGSITANLTGNVSGDVTGNVTGNVLGDVTGNVTGSLTGNASTATALAANPTDCSANDFAQSIDVQGNLTCAAIVLGTNTSGVYVQSVAAADGSLTVAGTASNPTLSVSFGASAGTAAQGNTALTFTGSGNLTGSLSGTAGGGFTTTTLAVSSTPSFTSVNAATLTGNLSGNVTGSLTGNASTATALANDPSDCAANTFATTINASGALNCSSVNLGTAAVTGSLSAASLQNAPADLGAANATVDLSNSHAGFVTNFITNGTINGLTLGSGGITANSDLALVSGGNITLSSNGSQLNCSALGSGGKLTTDASGNVICASDASGSGGVTISGTPNTVAIFNATGDNLTNSKLSQNAGATLLSLASGTDFNLVNGNLQVAGSIVLTSGKALQNLTGISLASGNLNLNGGNLTNGGSITAATFTGALSGNATTATALATNPTDCAANSFAVTIAANGNLTCASINVGTADITGNLLASNLQNATTDLGNTDINVVLSNSNVGHVTNLTTNGTITAATFSGALSGNVTGNVTGALTGNASTATALAADPSDCSVNTFATTINASGTLGCSNVNLGTAAVTGNLRASNLQNAAADLGAADVTIDLSNSHVGFNTNLTIDGNLTVGGSTVITNADVLQNVTANTSILTAGTLGVARGGTGIGSYATGDLLYASAATTLSRLADVATGSCLVSGGVGVAPQWGSCAAGGGITGSGTANTLPLFNSSGVLGDSWLSQSGTTLTLVSGKDLSLASGSVTATTFNGNLTGNVTGNVTGALTGNASTATALAVDPSDCSVNTFATTINASGNLTCAAIAANNLPSVAADLGAANVGIDLSNSHAGFNTNLTLDGNLSLGGTLNGLTISSGALTGITGITFTSGNLNLNNGNLTNGGTITASSFSGPLTGNVTGNVTGALTGNASTATALAVDPSDCSVNQFATGIVANGNLSCAALQASNLPSAAADLGAANTVINLSNSHAGFVTNLTVNGTVSAATFSGNLSGNVTGNVTGVLTGNASTATALAADPSDCAANSFATTIAASGNLTCAALKASNLPSAAADLGAANVTIDLSNTNGTFVTNLTTDGTITAATFSGALSGNVTGNVTGTLTGNASTATALAANPSDCAANSFATTIAANGNLTCAAIAANNLPSVAADLGAADVTIDLGNSHVGFNTNLSLDGNLSIGGSTVITSTDVLQNVTANTSILTAGTLGVARGGTGAGTFTTNGVLYGNGTGALQATSAGTSAQVLLANASGVPTFTSISGDISVSSTGATTIQGDSVALGTDTTGNYLATLTASSTSGLTVTGSGSENAAATVAVKLSATSTDSTTSSATGLELTTNGLQMLGGCTNGQLLKYNGTSWACAADSTGLSDSRLKTNIVSLGNELNTIKNLRVVTYNFDCLNSLLTSLKLDCNSHTGIISQELQSVLPGVVAQDSAGYYEVNFQELQFYTLRAVVQLAGMIDDSGNASLNSVSTSGTTRLTSGGALQNITGLTGSGALTLASGGSSSLTLSSASGVLGVSSGTSTIQRVASGTTTLDLNDTLATTLSLVNNGVAGVANLDLTDGGLKTNGTQRLSNGGALQNITGLTISSGGANVSGGISLSSGSLNLNSNGITNAGSVAGLSGLSGSGSLTLDLSSLSNDTFTITNSLTGVAGLSVEGGIAAGGNSTVAGTLSGISTLTSTTVNATGGFQTNGTAGIDASCTTSQYIGNSVVVSGGIITAGTCRSDASGLSDERVKTDIVSLDTSALEAIKNVNAINFSFDCSNAYFEESGTDCASGTQTGVLAQELATIFPNLVRTDDYGYYHVDYQGLSVYTLKAVSTLAQFIDSSGNANFTSLSVSGNTLLNGGLTAGDAIFNGHTAFDNTVAFGSAVDFNGPVTFNGQTHFNTNTGGYATVRAGQTTVHVSFAQAYDTAPIVSVTPGNGQSATYSTNNVTTTGFDIVLPLPATADQQFSWIALSVLNPATSAQ